MPKNGCQAAKNGCLAAKNGCLAAVSLPWQGPGRNRSPVPTVPAAWPGAEMANRPCARPKSRYQAPGEKKKKQCPSPVPITPRGPGARYGPKV